MALLLTRMPNFRLDLYWYVRYHWFVIVPTILFIPCTGTHFIDWRNKNDPCIWSLVLVFIFWAFYDIKSSSRIIGSILDLMITNIDAGKNAYFYYQTILSSIYCFDFDWTFCLLVSVFCCVHACPRTYCFNTLNCLHDFIHSWVIFKPSFLEPTFVPANIYLLKVNNGNIRKRCEIISKLLIKTLERHH